MTKSNKKGFTLIELLAVIAILAILMLLITPQILTLFTQSKKNGFVLEVQSIVKQADEKFLAGQLPGGTPTNSFCHIKGEHETTSLNLNFDDIMSYKVEISPSNGHITKLIATDGTYIFEKSITDASKDTIRITDISEKTVNDYSADTDASKITCSTTPAP